MKGYGQYCSVARALDLLGERWTLLVVRELLSGSTRFSEIQRGIPRISRTMLSARLRELLDAGVIERAGDATTYALTAAGLELANTVRELTDVRSRAGLRFLLLRRSEVSLCGENPGFPDELRVRAPLRTLTAWWRGDLSLAAARASGMIVDGRRPWVRAFPAWFERYLFAEVAPAK